jgi:CspA family cold shock protein
VLQFDQARGYGFVAADDGGEDVFLHASVYEGDVDILAPGTKVEFKVMAGDRGRKAFAAHAIYDRADSGDEATPAVRPAPPPMPGRPATSAALRVPAEDVADEEPLCDVLSPAELGQELTELLITNIPTLTGQQVMEVRQSVLECASKHGWTDI